MVCVFPCPPEEFAHKKLYGAVPPVTLAVMLPVEAPKHLMSVLVNVIFGVEQINVLITTDCSTVQLTASVTVTLYVPGVNELIEAFVALFDHKKVNGAVPPETFA